MSLSAGTRLGPYEILSPLGAGGMGEVYRARDPRLSREVAIKVLPAGLSAHPERLKRFEREARSASGLSHPNIVTIYDFGREGDTSYIAMELVGGESLRAELLKGAVPVRRLLQVAIQVADGLAKAHSLGIVHRDLKPENIMERFDSYYGIFGLAPGETVERELSWFGGSRPAGLSDDGRTLLFNEWGSKPTWGPAGAFYLRKTDGSPAVKLGDGTAKELSADGKWVLALSLDSEKNLVLVPTGIGTPVTIEEPGFETVQDAALFPDGKRLLLLAAEPGAKPRLYVQELPSGKPRPITESAFGWTGQPISPAGDWIAVEGLK